MFNLDNIMHKNLLGLKEIIIMLAVVIFTVLKNVVPPVDDL